MEILIDLHNHTIASGHAYSTMEEVISRAKKERQRFRYLGPCTCSTRWS